MAATATLPWPRSLLPLRAAATASQCCRRGGTQSRNFAAAALMDSKDSNELAKEARARAPEACWSSESPVAVLAPPPTSSSSSLPLSGLTFASKEMFDVAGQEHAFGSPAYRRWRKEASNSSSTSSSTSTSTITTAPIVAALVAAGATLVGRTTMSELAYALTGEHSFYPVPPNPAFEDDPTSPPRLCGGSSSGSACAVASRAVDFALGSDTGGSVRVPASYCGVFGFRPSRDRISMEGSQALAPSFDTAGWFARDAETLRDVGKVLLSLEGEGGGGGGRERKKEKRPSFELKRWLVAADAFDRARPDVSRAIFEVVAAHKIEIEEILSPPSEVSLWGGEGSEDEAGGGGFGGSKGARDAFRFAQAAEALKALGAFLDSDPELGPVAKERIEWARTVTREQEAEALRARASFSSRLDELLGDDGVIALPAAPDTAPLATSAAAAAAAASDDDAPPPPTPDSGSSRNALLELTAAAGLAGLPQLVLPAASLPPATVRGGGGPVGLSFIGPRGSDLELLELGVRLSRAMGLPSCK